MEDHDLATTGPHGDPDEPARADPAEDTDAFVSLRPLLFSIAYQMTGSVGDSEDIVSEAYLRLHTAREQGREIRNLKHYLASAVTRMSIDHLRSARVVRERYPGPWLPEPLIDSSAVVDFDRVELSDTISMAFLVLLESLTPSERAVFLLREVFEFGYPDVSAIVGKSEANCRQLLRRAKQQVDQGRPRFDADLRERDELASRFFTAIQEGNLDPLVEMLAEDVVMYGDGGGRGPSLPQPVNGRSKVFRLLQAFADAVATMHLHLEAVAVNGQPGVLARTVDGRLLNVLTVDIHDGRIQTVRSVINADKLQHLGPLLDAVETKGGATRRRSRG